MSNVKDIQVSAVVHDYQRTARNFPISPRENLMRAFRHEKPMWMPNLYLDSQHVGPGGIGFIGVDFVGGLNDGDIFENAWGGKFQYSEAQGSPTPIDCVMTDVSKWREEVRFPDYDALDIISSPPGFARDENLCSYTHVESVAFEQLHMQEGFEQALVDLISQPEKCREYFEANVDYQLEIVKRQNAVHHFDFVLYHDDWGTARAPFFSVDLWKETILPPTIRLAQGLKDLGVKFVFHNCGQINAFIPYIIEDIGADGLQIQTINDIKGILQTYGDRVTVEYQNPDPYLLFDPEATPNQIRALGRDIVDRYGALSNPGSGCITTINAPSAEVFNALDEEICAYSLEKYR
jgi:hypothetical protein